MRLQAVAIPACAVACVVACRAESPPAPRAEPRSTMSDRPAKAESKPLVVPEGPPPPAAKALPLRYPEAKRLVAFGDVHGDIQATRAVLRLVGAIDTNDGWIGGELVVVQTGDQLDRGDDEQEILDMLQRLEAEAKAAGGALHVLNGNHEIMNVAGDLRYVTDGGFADFADVPGLRLDDVALAEAPPAVRPRAAAFKPGGPYARVLARRNTAVVVGDTAFVHGGILPQHVDRLEQLNQDIREWMNGTAADPASTVEEIMAPDSMVWTRLYSMDGEAGACKTLQEALRKLNVKRMVVGHTVQKGGVTSACDDKVWRVDVGMARHYGGTPQAIEIVGGNVKVLK